MKQSRRDFLRLSLEGLGGLCIGGFAYYRFEDTNPKSSEYSKIINPIDSDALARLVSTPFQVSSSVQSRLNLFDAIKQKNLPIADDAIAFAVCSCGLVRSYVDKVIGQYLDVQSRLSVSDMSAMRLASGSSSDMVLDKKISNYIRLKEHTSIADEAIAMAISPSSNLVISSKDMLHNFIHIQQTIQSIDDIAGMKMAYVGSSFSNSLSERIDEFQLIKQRYPFIHDRAIALAVSKKSSFDPVVDKTLQAYFYVKQELDVLDDVSAMRMAYIRSNLALPVQERVRAYKQLVS